MFFGATRRLTMIVDVTTTCPERAPAGWHLYIGWGVPRPALKDIDPDTELELTMQDLREKVPAFAGARIVSTEVLRDDWPAQRALSGFDAPCATPVPGLWNVGDGVNAYGAGGLEACAQSARFVVEQIAAIGSPGQAFGKRSLST